MVIVGLIGIVVPILLIVSRQTSEQAFKFLCAENTLFDKISSELELACALVQQESANLQSIEQT